MEITTENEEGNKALAFPLMGVPMNVWSQRGEPPEVTKWKEACLMSILITRYADLLVVHSLDGWVLLPNLVLRQNLHTDPRKPVAVDPGLRGIGNPNQASPLLCTVNFALTYYTVVSDIEAAAIDCHVTNTVIFESYSFTFERELYLEYIRKKVERSIPPAIALDCVVLFLKYKFLSRLSRRIEIKKAIDLIGTYTITFALWLSYAMFHGLSGEYPPMALAVTWFSLGNMVAWGAFFYIAVRRAASRNI